MLAGKGDNLLDFGRCDVPGVDTAQTRAFSVDLEHDARGPFAIHAEKTLQDKYYKIHGCVVVVKQQNFVHGGRTRTDAFCFQYVLVLFSGGHAGHSNQVRAKFKGASGDLL